MQEGPGGEWRKPQRPPMLSGQGAIARAAYDLCGGYNPERLPLFAAVCRVTDPEITLDLMAVIATEEAGND